MIKERYLKVKTRSKRDDEGKKEGKETKSFHLNSCKLTLRNFEISVSVN